MTGRGTLLVFAHRDEAAAFSDVPHLVTGVGKVNAATELSAALADGEPDRVVVLGTAGLIVDDGPTLDTVCQITAAVQHDFSLPSPTLEFAGPLILPPEERAVVATGDVFVKNDAQRLGAARLGATLVDMECYAYARVCERFGVPAQVFKVPSDFADSSTTEEEWDEIVFHKSGQLRRFCEQRLPELLS